jgi:hypothetical protein
VCKTDERKDIMEKQTASKGLPVSVWAAIAIVGVGGVGLLLIALVLVAFGVDIGLGSA